MPASASDIRAEMRRRTRAACAWACQDRHKRKAQAACRRVATLFTQHPQETRETYLEHLLFTVKMAGRIVFCGLLLPIHGVFPFLFKRTTSSQMQKIYAILQARKMKGYDGMDPGI